MVVLAGFSDSSRSCLRESGLLTVLPHASVSVERLLQEPGGGIGHFFEALTQECSRLFLARASFVLDAGLTHPWVLSIMDRAEAMGYAVDLRFSEDIASDGVLAAPLATVSSRRTRAMALLPSAVARAAFSTLYSCSSDGSVCALSAQFERGLVVELPDGDRPGVPEWVTKSVLLPLRFRLSDLRVLRDLARTNDWPVEWASALADRPYVGRLRTLTAYYVPQFVDGTLVLHERAFLGAGPQIVAGRGLKIDYRVYQVGGDTPLIEDMGPSQRH